MAGNVQFESFVWVFLFGVVFFIVGAILFGGDMPGTGSSDSGGWFSQNGNADDERVLMRNNRIELDASAKLNSKFYSFGSFQIGEVVSESMMYDDETVMIQNGVFKKLSKEFSFERGSRKRVFLEFRIFDMNTYGNLMVDFNGNRIYDELGKSGKIYRIELNELDDVNEIQISASSSGARFWAPTTYILKNFKLTTLDSDMIKKGSEFSLTSKQYKGLDRAVLRFQADSASDDNPMDISIKLNGYEVYSDIPEKGKVNVVTIDDLTIFSIGKNTLDFESLQSTFFDMKNVDLECFFYDTSELEKKELLFSLSSKKYEEIENSTVKLGFLVPSPASAELKLEINGRDMDLDVSKGDNSLDVSGSYLKEGLNSIVFSSYGKWTLKNLRMVY